MGTHIFSGGDGAITQTANAWTFDPATPVHLKPKGDPGVAWHSNNSRAIKVPLGTVKEYGTDMANRYGAMDTGKHDPVSVIVGLFTKVKDHVNQHVTYVKSVVHEAGEMVVNGVTTLTNAILIKLAPETAKMIENGKNVLTGMELRHFSAAGQAQAEELLAMLKDPETYMGLAVSIGATAVQGVPVLGQAVGGAVMVDRAVGTGQAAIQAAEEIRNITANWGTEMTPAQMEHARMQLALWLMGSGMALLLALAGKFKRKTKSQGNSDQHPTTEHSDTKKPDGKGPCSQCATRFPVILSTGQKHLDETDFTLAGPIPIVWRRRYISGLAEESPWGRGWSHEFTQELRLSADGCVLADDTGLYVTLPSLPVGAEHFDIYEKFTLSHPEPDLWAITYKEGLSRLFRREAPEQWRLPLAALQDRDGNTVQLHWKYALGSDEPATTQTWSARYAAGQGAAPATQGKPHAPFARPLLAGLSDTAGRRLHLHWSAPGTLPLDAFAGARLTAVVLHAPEHAPQTLAQYAYDAQGQLISTHHGSQPYRQYAWRSGVLVGYRKSSGHRYFAQYDIEGPQGRVLRSWCADTPVPGQDDDRFTYLPHERVTRHTDGLGRTTAYHWDARFNIIATVIAEGTPEQIIEQTPTDATGASTGRIDPLGRRTTLRRDARGNLVQIIDAMGHATTLQYNPLDLVTTLRDALGHEWHQEYDGRGHLVQATDPLGRTTRYRHDARGRTVEVIDAKGGSKRLAWDEADRLVAYTDCSGQTTRFAYDALGQPVLRTDALGQQTRYEYNDAGQLIRVIEPSSPAGPSSQPASPTHLYVWNGEGHLLAYTDPMGQSTRYTYDGMGRPLTRIDAAGRSLAYHYDRAGRLIALDNENHARTHFRYDLRDQLTDEVGFDGRWQRYIYNAAGELTHVIEAGGSDAGPGKVTCFERDALGRLLAKRAMGHTGPVEETTYRYDALGRLTQAGNAASHLAFAYDPVGQLLSETQTLQALGNATGPARHKLQRSLSHGYDELGNRTHTRMPDGRTLHWLFYGSGHLHQINISAAQGPDQPPAAHQVIADMERDALHREVRRSQGALSSRYDWDPAGRLLRHRAALQGSGHVIRPGNSNATLERGYAYDAAGQLIARADSLRGRQDFRYDPTGRILASLPAQGSPLARELFAFDPAGNLLDSLPGKDGQPVDTTLGVVGDNRLRFYQDLHFEYDVHGNVTKRTRGNQKAGTQEVLDLTWNADHQLIESNTTRHGVTQATRYAYDPLGRRVAKSDAFGSTHYLWDGDLMVHSQRGARQALYIYEPGSFVPLATIQGAGEEHSTYWYQCDQIGAPLELTDEQGQVAWAADYKVWGEAVMRSVLRTGTDDQPVSARAWGSKPVAPPPPPPVEQPFRFQGQQFDEETGLHYNRFRYYDPVVGKFISQDPIRFLGDHNFYTFAPNTTEWIDPLGLVNSCATGSYKTVGGHHVHAKAAWNDLSNYKQIMNDMFCLGNDWMKNNGIDHDKITACQRREFDRLSCDCKSGKSKNTISEHTKIAVECLKEGGADEKTARSLAAQSLRKLRSLGATTPSRIPWNK
ncbi:RHS repeat-associated core domain-containing protein [Delftia tsuruhatensis]|uniref:RHS repeat-associated core domain-containing protein n=1 Tax=Delftia tsuruhatensis TaxID=180282 RepID=UPI0028A88C38|nr:RHS repeat-associated core domain-containing protein [Delftia tsuruhatensis]